MSKKIIISQAIFMMLLFVSICTTEAKTHCNVNIQNSSNMDFTQHVVEIPWQDIVNQEGNIDTSKLVITDKTSNQLPIQFETKGKNTIQNLLVQVTIPANTTIKLFIKSGNRKKEVRKTYCRYVPERYDDFAWENDKIAFRMYGEALESTSFNAYGIDVWAKRTSNMIIDKWYKSGEYHTDFGEGLDFYGVGFSLGAGSCTPFIKDSIYYSKNYKTYKVLDNGPLRSTFILKYAPWEVGDKMVSAEKTIQLDAGSNLNKISAKFTFEGVDSLSVVVGINKKIGADIKYLDEQDNIMGYWLPRDSINGTIGVGVLMNAKTQEMLFFKKHLLSKVSVKTNQPLCYYAGACWDKAGVFTNEQIWFNYLIENRLKLKHPLKITFN